MHALVKTSPLKRLGGALSLLAMVASTTAAPAPPLEATLDRVVPELLRDYSVPGAAIGIIRRERVVSLRGYGMAEIETRSPVTADTLFNAGSISKTLTAWGLMHLAEQGKIDTDKPVGVYIKRWQLPASSFDASAITFSRVLSHTSGISTHGYDGVGTSVPRAGVIDLLDGKTGKGSATLEAAPGSRFLYSGANYLIAQLVIEDVSGMDFRQYMGRVVFRPLGMRSTTFDPPADGSPFARPYDGFMKPLPRLRYDALPAAALCTTLRDLSRFAIAAFPAHRGAGDLSRTTVERMQTAAANSVWTPRDPLGPSPAYGLGFTVRPEQFLGHPGIGHGGSNSGWESLFQIIPATGDGIVILTNSSNGTALISAILCEWRRAADSAATCPTIDVRIPLLAKYRAAGVDAAVAFYDLLRTQPDRYDLAVSQLNSLGYQLLRAGDQAAAIRMFERNCAAFPAEWNVFDSLAEAQALAGNRTGAITNYRRSLELNPHNDHGRQMLKQLGAPPD
jgi:CubicO group peptidase (beta-lactamase class C family)